jgi:adenylate cyclase
MQHDDGQFEVERRFLVNDPSIADGPDWELITQAYVFSADGFSVRIRLVQSPRTDSDELDNISATVTVKGPRFEARREEYETAVSSIVARGIISRSGSVIRKRRHYVVTDQTWEVDEFLDDNAGLWIAELEGTDQEALLRLRAPEWARNEVTRDNRYDNDQLALNPFSTW